MTERARARLIGLGWCLCGVAGGLAVWTAAGSYRAACESQAEILSARQELRRLSSQQPAVTPSNLDDTNREIARMRTEIALLREQLAGSTAESGQAAVAETDNSAQGAADYFELSAFVDRMRAEAERAGIALRDDEWFGFSQYAHRAPDRAERVRVRRNRRHTADLLRVLFAARAQALVSLEQEADAEAGRPIEPASALTGSVRHPGWIETTVLRLQFVGSTGSLRELLNGLAAAESSLAVRRVDVEAPVDSDSSAARKREPWGATACMRFSVVVEGVSLANNEPGSG